MSIFNPICSFEGVSDTHNRISVTREKSTFDGNKDLKTGGLVDLKRFPFGRSFAVILLLLLF